MVTPPIVSFVSNVSSSGGVNLVLSLSTARASNERTERSRTDPGVAADFCEQRSFSSFIGQLGWLRSLVSYCMSSGVSSGTGAICDVPRTARILEPEIPDGAGLRLVACRIRR